MIYLEEARDQSQIVSTDSNESLLAPAARAELLTAAVSLHDTGRRHPDSVDNVVFHNSYTLHHVRSQARTSYPPPHIVMEKNSQNVQVKVVLT